MAAPFTYSYRGVQMRSVSAPVGGVDSGVIVQRIKGLSPPSMRIRDTYKSLTDGEFPGLDSRTARAILLHAEVLAVPGGSVEDILTPLRAAFAPAAALYPFAFQFPGLPSLVSFCRPRRCDYELDERYAAGSVTVDLELYAPDPNLYDDPVSVASTPPYASQGGAVLPLVFPLVFTAAVGVGNAGVVVVTNRGTMPAPVVLSINGYAEGPVIENVTTGTVFELTMNLQATDNVRVDSQASTVLLGASADYLGAMTMASDFIMLAPGPNEIHFHTRGVAGPGALLTVTWRNAYA